MSIIRTTAYPSHYACQAYEEQMEDVSTGMEETCWEESTRGRILAIFDETVKQREQDRHRQKKAMELA